LFFSFLFLSLEKVNHMAEVEKNSIRKIEYIHYQPSNDINDFIFYFKKYALPHIRAFIAKLKLRKK
jgi:hypothetical protein